MRSFGHRLDAGIEPDALVALVRELADGDVHGSSCNCRCPGHLDSRRVMRAARKRDVDGLHP